MELESLESVVELPFVFPLVVVLVQVSAFDRIVMYLVLMVVLL